MAKRSRDIAMKDSDRISSAIMRSDARKNFEQFVLAMYLLYLRAPSDPEPNPDGSFDLGEIGDVRLNDQRLLRDTPYSICRGIR